MEKIEHLDYLPEFLNEAEKNIKTEEDRRVQVEHCINIKELRDYKVTCSYGDMVLIICILKDYLKLSAGKEDFMWDYYRNRFAKLADRLSEQIEYDYEAQVERCRKKMNSKGKGDDVGEDAMIMAVKNRKKEGGKRGRDGG